MPIKALLIRIIGLVQGVGFRPFIYRIATANNLTGYVRNLGGAEVEIYIEGREENLKNFLRDLYDKKPPPSKIQEIFIEEVTPKGFKEFKILKSSKTKSRLSMIPPDFGICEYCLKEVLDPNSRWYRYPFNSCAWCGPRFTMIYNVPYDRENTAMRDFPLCTECRAEYEDPNNLRRFHAQGISCPKCGPRVFLLNKSKKIICKDYDAITRTAELIDEGYIIAVKGIGGFHIACLATDDDIVLELRKRKNRPFKPFALMALNLEIASKLIEVDSLIRELLTSIEKPIVVAKKRENATVSEYVAPRLDSLGVMLPYTALHYLLLMNTKDKFLIMTSGNPKGRPICIDEQEAFVKLANIVDYFLIHNRKIVNRADDSVIRITQGRPIFLRRSRGYVPLWLITPFTLKKSVIAVGALLANTGAIGIEKYVIPTQYIGDVDNYENLKYLETALTYLIRNYKIDIRKSVMVADLHPLYSSRKLAEKWAEKYGIEVKYVQHHHAHIASVMLDYKIPINEEVIGIAIDGIGYGLDGRIWGGEVLLTKYDSFKRVGHLMYQPLPGGDLAVRYPIRSLIGLLSLKMSYEEVIKTCYKLGLVDKLKYKDRELEVIVLQLEKKSYPLASSTGRFLDAISALLGICYERTYEGEPAISLEAFSKNGKEIDLDYTKYIKYENDKYIVDTPELLIDLINMLDKYDKRDIAITAQITLGRLLGEIALRVKRKHRYLIVSGGAAVNNYIIKGIQDVLYDKLKVLLPRQIPANDGGISTGQIAVTAVRDNLIEEK